MANSVQTSLLGHKPSGVPVELGALTGVKPCSTYARFPMLLSHRIRIEANSAQRDYFARAAGLALPPKSFRRQAGKSRLPGTTPVSRTVRGRKRTLRTCAQVFDSSLKKINSESFHDEFKRSKTSDRDPYAGTGCACGRD
jgi:hypothetical protein